MILNDLVGSFVAGVAMVGHYNPQETSKAGYALCDDNTTGRHNCACKLVFACAQSTASNEHACILVTALLDVKTAGAVMVCKVP